MSDPGRRGKVKFFQDPACTAAKKKFVSERQAEINTSSKPFLPTAGTIVSKLSKIPEENESCAANREVTEAFESNEPQFPDEEEVAGAQA